MKQGKKIIFSTRSYQYLQDQLCLSGDFECV
jgi:hypothetical protein